MGLLFMVNIVKLVVMMKALIFIFILFFIHLWVFIKIMVLIWDEVWSLIPANVFISAIWSLCFSVFIVNKKILCLIVWLRSFTLKRFSCLWLTFLYQLRIISALIILSCHLRLILLKHFLILLIFFFILKQYITHKITRRACILP